MSQENVEIVRRAYLAMSIGDVSGVADCASPDIEWIPDRRVAEGPIHGREEVIGFFTDRTSMFASVHYELERVWDQGDQVLAFLHVSGSGAASGAGFDIRIAHLWTLSQGKLVRGERFGDREEALEAAGLRE